MLSLFLNFQIFCRKLYKNQYAVFSSYGSWSKEIHININYHLNITIAKIVKLKIRKNFQMNQFLGRINAYNSLNLKFSGEVFDFKLDGSSRCCLWITNINFSTRIKITQSLTINLFHKHIFIIYNSFFVIFQSLKNVIEYSILNNIFICSIFETFVLESICYFLWLKII